MRNHKDKQKPLHSFSFADSTFNKSVQSETFVYITILFFVLISSTSSLSSKSCVVNINLFQNNMGRSIFMKAPYLWPLHRGSDRRLAHTPVFEVNLEQPCTNNHIRPLSDPYKEETAWPYVWVCVHEKGWSTCLTQTKYSNDSLGELESNLWKKAESVETKEDKMVYLYTSHNKHKHSTVL